MGAIQGSDGSFMKKKTTFHYTPVLRLLLAIALAVLIGLSIESYSRSDWDTVADNEHGLWYGIWNTHVENSCGIVGSAFSHVLIGLLGPAAAWFPPIWLALFGICVFWKSLARRFVKWTVILFVSMILVSTMGSYTADSDSDAGIRGGSIGMLIHSSGVQLAGRTGLGIVLIVCIVLVPLYAASDIIKRLEHSLKTRPRIPRRRKKEERIPDRSETEAFNEPTPQKTESPPERTRTVGNDTNIESVDLIPGPGPYSLPPLDILRQNGSSHAVASKHEVESGMARLEEALDSFGVHAKVVRSVPGPVITRYEVEPAPGVKVARIAALSHDLALALKALRIRVVAPIPGTGVVGIEVPNRNSSIVRLGDIIRSGQFQGSRSPLTLPMGKDTVGDPVVIDLTSLPHLLIGGTTGSGKSSCINSFICGLLMRVTPQQVRLLLVDPKRVELIGYDGIPHLLHPVITDPKMALRLLLWAVQEMERRYTVLAENGIRDIYSYNSTISEGMERIPYVVIIIDELADLMMTAPGEIEGAIIRLAQKARAVGIHLIVATQRPSKEIVTGVLKSNFPGRIAFHVMQKVNSNIILDHVGAEKLLGKGDMLFLSPGFPAPQRFHGAFVTPNEIGNLVGHWKKQSEPSEERQPDRIESAVSDHLSEPQDVEDSLWEDAARLVILNKQGSTSLVQRRLKVGYARAGRLMDILERKGVVGPPQGSKPRDVLVDASWLQEHDL